jgi:DNA-binding NarL/FixJ family response regulator
MTEQTAQESAPAFKGLVCASDSMVRQAASSAIVQAGYELAGETASGADTVALARFTNPDLFILDNDLPGQSGIDWVPELQRDHPTAAVLLIANDENIRARAMEYGAFGVVYRSQLAELEGALRRAAAWLADPELRQPGERRTGKDRRWHQDWMQVTHERRAGGDRRQADKTPPGSGAR